MYLYQNHNNGHCHLLQQMERILLLPSHNNCLFTIFFLKIIVTLKYQCNIYYYFLIIIPLFIESHPT